MLLIDAETICRIATMTIYFTISTVVKNNMNVYLTTTSIISRVEAFIRKHRSILMLAIGAASVALSLREHFRVPVLLECTLAGLLVELHAVLTTPATITYGVGMACSFFEGYLTHIIPDTGAEFVGFEQNIRNYEDYHKVVFPVKMLFLIIPKTLYCPPHLKTDMSVFPFLEVCNPLPDVQKSVAGVKDRVYRNSVYKIHRRGARPVYVAAEYATPLHTLRRALADRALPALRRADAAALRDEFTAALADILWHSRECRGRCRLVVYDDEKENLASVLLREVAALRPGFEADAAAAGGDGPGAAGAAGDLTQE